MKAKERRAQLLEIMNELHQKAQNQADFTPAKIAEAAGISRVWFYKLVRPEFQVLRSQLTGTRILRDEELFQLRRENADLRQQLKKAQLELRTTAIKDLDEAILLIERYEKENIQFRQQIALLQKRLEDGGHVIVQQIPSESARSHLTLVNTSDTHLK